MNTDERGWNTEKWNVSYLRASACICVHQRPIVNGPQRYNQLLGTVTAISQKELTRNLRELTDAGLVARDSGTSRTAEYDLTKLGKASCRHSRNC